MHTGLKRKIRRYIPYLWGTGFFALGLLLCLGIYHLLAPVRTFFSGHSLTPAWIIRTIQGNTQDIAQTQGRVNIGFFGIPGGSHEGSTLTDSIQLISLNLPSRELAIISVPRDIWISDLKDKVNSAYTYGEEKKEGGGMILAKSTLSQILGVPVHYGILMDFSGFTSIIDALGGIRIYVTEGFSDASFPIEGKENDPCNGDAAYSCRYESLTFESGWQTMDGKRALKYVRSRHAAGNEGTDFARGKRQQEVIIGIKNRILSDGLWKDPDRMIELFEILKKHVKTDIPTNDLITLILTVGFHPPEQIQRFGLGNIDPDSGFPNLLSNPPAWAYGGAWVLVPTDGTFDQIHAFIQCNLYGSSRPDSCRDANIER